MNYRAAGPVVEISYGSRWFIAGGLHAGGLIVNAMARSGAAQPEGAEAGAYFKGDGYFVAPSADVGYRFRRGEVGVFVKRVNVFGETIAAGCRSLIHVCGAAVRVRAVVGRRRGDWGGVPLQNDAGLQPAIRRSIVCARGTR